VPESEAEAGLPVTVVISREPAPGREQELLEWARRVTEAAASFPGHLGAEIFPPEGTDNHDVVIAFSFASADALSTWEHSDVRRDWLARSAPLVVGDMRVHGVSGFEGIFSHAPGQAVVPPPRWKTAAVITLALFPVSLLLNWLLNPYLSSWNVVAKVVLNLVIMVPYMSWVGVPYLSRWLRDWLHA
jgi:antibiotic biosynthesis monooxygenase (ABM) superfamily enzyme